MFYPIMFNHGIPKEYPRQRLYGLAIVSLRFKSEQIRTIETKDITFLNKKDIEITGFWNDDDYLSSANATEYPKLYKNVKAACRRLLSLNEENGKDIISLAIWIHNDYSSTPIEKYLLMERRFPGCPRS